MRQIRMDSVIRLTCPLAADVPAYSAPADSPPAQGINEKTGRLRRYIPQQALTSLITSAISGTWPAK